MTTVNQRRAPMQVKHIVWSCAGGFFLVLASVSYAADTPGDMTVTSPPDAAVAPADVTAAAPGDSTTTPSSEAASTAPDQVAVETPANVRATSAEQQMAPDSCAGASAAGSLDCEKLKRKVSIDKT